MIQILTKQDCVNCNKLKMFIAHALNDEQRSKLQIILKEDDEVYYQELVDKYNVLSLPTVISNDITYADILPSKLVELISKV